MFTESLFAAALSFSAWHGDVESSEARSVRLKTIAEAINIATLHAVCAKNAPPLPTLVERPESDKAKSSEQPETNPDCKPLWRGHPRDLAFLLLTQARYETRLAAHVHEGRCRTHLGECDGGKAISLWQLQAGAHLPKERWEMLSGTDLASTTHAAVEAARALSRGLNYCGNVTGAISLFATGRTCKWKPAAGRASFWKRMSARY